MDWNEILKQIPVILIGLLTIYQTFRTEKMKNEISNRQVSIDDKKVEIEQKRADVTDSKTLVDTAIGLIDKLEERVDDLTCQLQLLAQENTNLKNKIEELTKENKQLRDRIALFERALLESPLYRLFFEQLGFPALIIDMDEGIIYDSNKQFYHQYGYTEDEAGHIDFKDLFVNINEADKILRDRITTIPRVEHRDKFGKKFFVKLRACYMDHKDNAYALCVFVIEEIIAIN